jgi:glutathione S-transferase
VKVKQGRGTGAVLERFPLHALRNEGRPMLKFHYAPQSRASGMLWLLEELGEPYEIELVDIRAEGGAPESYRTVQPNKKVPAIEHDGTIVTERAAICLYLCERFPAARLAPEGLSPERAPFLTWLVYCDAVLDPVLAARALGWKYEGSHVSFGDFDAMVANLERVLASRPFIAGRKFHRRRHPACQRHLLGDGPDEGASRTEALSRLCQPRLRAARICALHGDRAEIPRGR